MLRRLHHDQPDSFAFTPANRAWAQAQMKKFPDGRQASAIIPLLWRAQEQDGWLSRPAIEHVADILGMAHIRALEVATFYFMFQLRPVGSVAHVQVCGTTTCMICGAEDLIAVCRDKIADAAHEISADGRFSWEEVECLGACANAPMVQIGKDFYEDLTAESFAALLDAFARGEVPAPGPQNGRFAAEPKSGLTSLKDYEGGEAHNGSVARALAWGDTVTRIRGDEVPVLKPAGATAPARKAATPAKPATTAPARDAGTKQTDRGGAKKPPVLKKAKGKADDLKQIKGVGEKLEKLLNSMGFFHFDQIAGWTAAQADWVDGNLKGFKGRATRDDWVGQARILATGGKTAFSARVAKGEV